MMWKATCIVLLVTFCGLALARPTQIEDIFAGYLKNVNIYNPDKQSQIVKRRIYEDNSDTEIKKVSLQSLIGDLESNFFQSVSSVGGFSQQAPGVPEATSAQVESHLVNKRKAENAVQVDKIGTQKSSENSEETTIADLVETTTEKISTKETGTTRIQVEHISVQPHFGDLPVVPAFQVHHTKLISATFKDTDSKPTQITITKTNIHAGPVQGDSEKIDDHKEQSKAQEAEDKVNEHTEKSDEFNQPATTERPETLITTTTTKKSVSELKETEAELKEKVAEIEAEPVILSARV
ncbi:uncharacterized protein LOC118748151 [Rhagoletis pomonella]|uniref:uncharacterized protein LOC118748151 n=1 Tax=Rhagoletis pomonella TaxID=28610 RepID=UPI001780E86B|nr:uncharacterized protein LOC118748151 [Rhagoletis pomonella]